jgi:hypothetical protein
MACNSKFELSPLFPSLDCSPRLVQSIVLDLILSYHLLAGLDRQSLPCPNYQN